MDYLHLKLLGSKLFQVRNIGGAPPSTLARADDSSFHLEWSKTTIKPWENVID